MNPESYFQVYEDFTLSKKDYIYFEGIMIELSYKEDVRLINGELHKLINKINLN